MKQFILFIGAVFLLCTSHVMAKDLENLTYNEIMKKSIYYASQVDAYGRYCERPSDMSKVLIALFKRKEKIDDRQKNAYEVYRKEVLGTTYNTLKDQSPDCASIDVTMQRFEIMKELKIYSYMLNGVAPSDIPKDPDIPSIEDFVLDKPM